MHPTWGRSLCNRLPWYDEELSYDFRKKDDLTVYISPSLPCHLTFATLPDVRKQRLAGGGSCILSLEGEKVEKKVIYCFQSLSKSKQCFSISVHVCVSCVCLCTALDGFLQKKWLLGMGYSP